MALRNRELVWDEPTLVGARSGLARSVWPRKRRWFGRDRTIVRKHYAKIATTRERTGHDQTHAG